MNTNTDGVSAMSAELCVGDKIRTLTSIWDDGADHHPPGYLANRGEVLVVRKIRERWLCVSHEDITDSSFCIHPGEWERVPHNAEAKGPRSGPA